MDTVLRSLKFLMEAAGTARAVVWFVSVLCKVRVTFVEYCRRLDHFFESRKPRLVEKYQDPSWFHMEYGMGRIGKFFHLCRGDGAAKTVRSLRLNQWEGQCPTFNCAERRGRQAAWGSISLLEPVRYARRCSDDPLFVEKLLHGPSSV